ncbi:hypothetical protein BKA64DRAFT_679711 [Cadophora sp. MPI-SDFR-AT-0126]|nr:hypothetical protein BKA64DRAFT_679711 [Leotiomycetes sp. MPI-SDFR-AT-0126]
MREMRLGHTSTSRVLRFLLFVLCLPDRRDGTLSLPRPLRHKTPTAPDRCSSHGVAPLASVPSLNKPKLQIYYFILLQDH